MSNVPNSSSNWAEPQGSAAASSIVAAGYRKDNDFWEPVVVSDAVPTQGRYLDVGEGPSLFDVSEAWAWASDGAGGLELAAPGATPAGQLIDDGAGGLLLTTDMSQPAAGSMFADSSGDVIPVRLDAPELKLMKVGDDFITYE